MTSSPKLNNPLFPRGSYVASRRWAFWVNGIAASPYVRSERRKDIYRRMGMDVSPESWNFGSRCYFHSSDISIGSRTLVNDFVYVENVAPVTIGSGVAIAAHAAIITSKHVMGLSTQRAGGWGYLPVTIEDGCWIGVRAVIMPGVTVGRGTVIGAGAVVVKDCEPNCVYAGVPARILRRLGD